MLALFSGQYGVSSPVYAFMLNEVEMASSPVPVKAAKEHAEGPFALSD